MSFRQDSLDIYQEAVFLCDANQVAICPKLVVHLKEFAREWDRNIEAQGFLKVAQGAQS